MFVNHRFLNSDKPWVVITLAVSPATLFASKARLSIYSTIFSGKNFDLVASVHWGFYGAYKVDKPERSIESTTYLLNLTDCYLRCLGWIRAPFTVFSGLVPHPHNSVRWQ